MCLAYSAIESLLAQLPDGWLESARAKLGMVLGTSHGELDHTIQFLRGLGAAGVARPFLFQNSLHNATLGFLSQRLGICGPGFTVSHRFGSGEDSLELATDLIDSGALDFCIAVGVESLAPDFETVLTSTYPAKVKLTEGAGAVLLSRADISPLPPLAFLTGLSRDAVPSPPPASLNAYYDSNAVECLANAISKPVIPARIRMEKPDGRKSWIELSPC
jgi:hypothetical protein